jgi:molybdenum transport protein
LYHIADDTIERLIKEDIPYLDLTTWVLGIASEPGRLEFYNREDAVLCGTEEVERICRRLDVKVIRALPSGSALAPGETFLEAEGAAGDLHMVWKVSLNILEYCSGIATRTRRLVKKASAVNPRLAVVTTRKNFPGTKELAIKAVLAGGGFPHRLGLSETILIFEQHRNFLNGSAELIRMIPELKAKACEKKLIVEVEGVEEAVSLAKAGVDGIQFDKASPEQLRSYVKTLREIEPRIVLLAAGGVTEANIADYAATGIDAVATTAVYFGKPADMGTRIVRG